MKHQRDESNQIDQNAHIIDVVLPHHGMAIGNATGMKDRTAPHDGAIVSVLPKIGQHRLR